MIRKRAQRFFLFGRANTMSDLASRTTLRRTLMLLFLALAAAPVSVPARSAQPPSPAEVATKWGIIGRWGLDCVARPGSGTIVSYEIDKSGRLIYRRDDNPADNNVISDAYLDDQMLVLVIRFERAGDVRKNIVSKESDGRIRPYHNQSLSNDSFTIRDGRSVANGKLTPALRRCES